MPRYCQILVDYILLIFNIYFYLAMNTFSHRKELISGWIILCGCPSSGPQTRRLGTNAGLAKQCLPARVIWLNLSGIGGTLHLHQFRIHHLFPHQRDISLEKSGCRRFTTLHRSSLDAKTSHGIGSKGTVSSGSACPRHQGLLLQFGCRAPLFQGV